MNVAIVEDDEQYAKLLKEYLVRLSTQEDYVFKADCYKDGLDFLENYNGNYEIVLLDVDMPYMDGFEVARKVREKGFIGSLLFVTNMAQYAIKGYEVDAIDYLVKPVEYFNFIVKLKKAINHSKERQSEYIYVSSTGGGVCIAKTDLSYIEVSNHTLIFHLQKRVVEVRGALYVYESMLEGQGFGKCNNCYLVNFKYISSVGNGVVNLITGEELKISAPRKKKFVTELERYYHNNGQKA